MDPSVLKNLIAALETIYNVSVTNEARQQAQGFCERLKGDPSGPLYGYFLAHKDNRQPDVVRHFGLGLIENAVRYRWTDGTLTPELRAQIRQNVMSLAADGALPLLTEQTFIKEKIARLFVEVAKREWPVEWIDMDPFLRELFFKDETSREMSLLILRSLCEDVCIYDDAVAGLRKKDLREGLIVIMASEAVLKKHYPEGVKGHKNQVTLMVGESGNDGWTSRISTLLQELLPRCQTEVRQQADEKIALAALKLLSCSLDWIMTTSIATAFIIPVICQAMLSPAEKIRLAAAECYDVLSCRNLTDADREQVIWPLLDGEGIELISKAYQAYATQIVQGDAYIFVQKVVQATVNLGEQQMCGKRNAHVPKKLLTFLQLVYSMASHPSVLISSIASFFWGTLLRHETFSKDPIVHSFVPPLLELYSTHLAKAHDNRRKVDPVYDHFASIDFDSTADFRARAGQTFQQTVNVIHLGVPIVPLDAFMWMANKVSEALKVDFPLDKKVKDTTQFMSFDGTLTLMEVTVSSLSDVIRDTSHPQSAQVLEAMNTLLLMVIEYNGKSPVALDRVVASFAAFTDMFKINSTLLFKCLDKLFQAVEYPIPGGILAEGEVRDLRSRSAITLVKIGRAIPDTLYGIYGEIDSAVQRLIQEDKIFPGEKKWLLSFLLTVGFNTMTGIEGRARIFENIVLPVATDFASLEIQQALSDPRLFMAYVGANDISEAAKKIIPYSELERIQGVVRQRRSKLSWSVDTLLMFMKETVLDANDSKQVELWSLCLGSILPNLLSTIRCLNALCNEALWAGMASEMAGVLNMSMEEKETMVNGQVKSSTVTSVSAGTLLSDHLTIVKLVSDLKTWLSVLRDHAYRFLARISILGSVFYSIPSLQTILEQSLFQEVDHLTNRQLRLQINAAVQPIVLNCPVEAMGPVLGHLLQVLFPYLDKRLSDDWKRASDEGLVITDEKEDPEDLDVSDEIVSEIMLRDLTRYVATFVHSTLEFSKKKPEALPNIAGEGHNHAPTKKESSTPLALFILSNEVIAQSVIPLICHLMTYKDTRSCIKTAETALCVLTTLVQNLPSTQNLLSIFSNRVLRAAMEALHDPYHQEGQDKLILVITEVYVEVRAFDEGPKLVFQQAVGADMARLEVFERELSSEMSRTKKHALVRNFLQSIIGVAKSEWFKQKELGNKSLSSRTITGTYERPSASALDTASDHDVIGDDLASLFE